MANTSNIKKISDSKLDELLNLLHHACQIIGTEDSFRENMADEDYINLKQTKLRVFAEIQNRTKLNI